MNKLFATLEELSSPVTTESGRKADSVAVYRLTFGQAAPIFGTDDALQRIASFCAAACRTADPENERIKPETLEAVDAAELVSALVEMSEADKGLQFEGDGMTHPIVYNLKFPITLAEGQEVKQFEFKARTLGEITAFLNAEGEVASFREFMRSFSGIIGVPMPVTDTLIDSFDVADYVNIKEHIMGKLTRSRGRLKKAS